MQVNGEDFLLPSTRPQAVKKVKLLSGLAFMSRCRDKNIVPICCKLKRPSKAASVNRIFDRTGAGPWPVGGEDVCNTHGRGLVVPPGGPKGAVAMDAKLLRTFGINNRILEALNI